MKKVITLLNLPVIAIVYIILAIIFGLFYLDRSKLHDENGNFDQNRVVIQGFDFFNRNDKLKKHLIYSMYLIILYIILRIWI
jgi:hypothetical protein